MSDRVLPAGGCRGKVGEALQDPAVDFFDWQALVGGMLDRHVNEKAERVRGLGRGGFFCRVLVAGRRERWHAVALNVIQGANDGQTLTSEAEVC